MTTTEQDTPGVTITATELDILQTARAILRRLGATVYEDDYRTARTRAYAQVAADSIFSALNVAKAYCDVSMTDWQLHG